MILESFTIQNTEISKQNKMNNKKVYCATKIVLYKNDTKIVDNCK